MLYRPLAIAAAAVALIAAPVWAQRLPPADAMPLSRILADLEQSQPVRAFTDIEWDDDGYWEIDYIDSDTDREVELRIDPANGEVIRRDGRRPRD